MNTLDRLKPYGITLGCALMIATVLLVGNGCFLDSMVRATGRPVSTNEIPRVHVVSVTNTVFVTNTVAATTNAAGTVTPAAVAIVQTDSISYAAVTNFISVTNYGPKPSIETGLQVATAAAEAAGIPWAPTILGGLGTLFGGLFGVYNRRKAQEAAGQVNFMEQVNGALVDGTEGIKKVALSIAKQTGNTSFPEKVNDHINTVLQGTQVAAGVEDYVRKLVHERTGYSKLESGIVLTPDAGKV